MNQRHLSQYFFSFSSSLQLTCFLKVYLFCLDSHPDHCIICLSAPSYSSSGNVLSWIPSVCRDPAELILLFLLPTTYLPSPVSPPHMTTGPCSLPWLLSRCFPDAALILSLSSFQAAPSRVFYLLLSKKSFPWGGDFLLPVFIYLLLLPVFDVKFILFAFFVLQSLFFLTFCLTSHWRLLLSLLLLFFLPVSTFRASF